VYEAGGNHYGDGGIYDPQLDKFYSKEDFLKKAKEEPGRFIVAYYAYRIPWIVPMLRTPHMTIGSDAVLNSSGPKGFDTPFKEYAGHPRTTGTHGKALRLARENDVPLMDVLANTSYYPAKHLGDAGIEAMQIRGRMQEGMIADITIFDPENVTDNATYKAGEQGLPTTGIPYVIINGQIVVKDSKVLQVYAGQPIRYPAEDQGRYEPVSEEAWLLQFPEKYK
jgi:N-acyl-D-aspartate/D-glutamate deacylase